MPFPIVRYYMGIAQYLGSLERELVGYPVAPQAAILGHAALPGWAKLAMVVRGGEILMADAAGAFAPGEGQHGDGL